VVTIIRLIKSFLSGVKWAFGEYNDLYLADSTEVKIDGRGAYKIFPFKSNRYEKQLVNPRFVFG
jgi:hypothetical protein